MRTLFIGCIFFILVLLLYLYTLPNIHTGFADSDEFIIAAKIRGVVHPSGYPLYTMLAIVAGMLPVPLSFAGKVNAVSAVLHAGTAMLVFFIAKLMLEKYTEEKEGASLSAFFGAGALALSFSFWFFALFAEVFSLNNFLIAVMILILLIWERTKQDRMLVWAGFVFGLGLSNQQTILLLVPAFFFFLVLLDHTVLARWKTMLGAAGCMVLGFVLPYLYLPYAASHNPILNWEHPTTLQSVINSITRASYADAQGSGAYLSIKGISVSQRMLGLQLYVLYLLTNFSWLYSVLGLSGALYLSIKKKWGILTLLLLGILGGGLFFSFYSPPAITVNSLYERGIHYRFYIASLLFFTLFIAFGVHALYQLANRTVPRYAFMVYVVVSFISLYGGVTHGREIRANNFGIGNRYAKALLQSLEKKALLICYTEQSCFSAVYVQIDEKIRPDVTIIPANLLQFPLEQIKTKYPGLIKTTLPRKDARHSVRIIHDIIRWNIDKRPLYVAGIHSNNDIYALGGTPFFLIPQGCAMKVSREFTLLKKSAECEAVERESQETFFTSKAPISQMFPLYIAFQRYIDYLQYESVGCVKRAEQSYKEALALNPVVGVVVPKPNFSQPDTCAKGAHALTVEELLKNIQKASTDQKIAAYYEASLIDPSNIEIRLELAALAKKSGDEERARIEYQDILVIDPANKGAQEALIKK